MSEADAGDRGGSVDVDKITNPQSNGCLVNEGSTVVFGGGESGDVIGKEQRDQGEIEEDGVVGGEQGAQKEVDDLFGDQGGNGDVQVDGGEVKVKKSASVEEGEQAMELEAPKSKKQVKRKNAVAAV